MSSFSDFLEKELLDHVWSAATYTAPVTFFLALYTVAPTDAGGGTEVPALFAYVRAPSTNDATEWPAATGTTPTLKQNANDITFATASGGSWGTVVAFSFNSLAVAGDFIAWADLDTNKTIDDGDTAVFKALAISITLD